MYLNGVFVFFPTFRQTRGGLERNTEEQLTPAITLVMSGQVMRATCEWLLLIHANKPEKRVFTRGEWVKLIREGGFTPHRHKSLE